MRSEFETNINWTRADEGKALIYSSDPAMIRKLKKNPAAKVVETHRSEDGSITGEEFEFSVALLSFRSVRKAGAKKAVSQRTLDALRTARERKRQAHEVGKAA